MAKLKNILFVEELVNAKYINKIYHPTNPNLVMYNYSKTAQFEGVWNEETIQCRGIIVDRDYNIVARPFEKFFNYEEITDKSQIPNLPFEIYNKLDGSLGILYWDNDTPRITTRGSFVSEQGEHATHLLHTKYKDVIPLLDRSKTYLFEIIYPENRLVVNYYDTDDIFLLAVVDIESGEETDIYNYSHLFKCVERYDGINDYTKVRELFSGENKEGFVIKFANNYRIKMKFEEYWRIHFILSGMSKKRILEAIVDGRIDELKELINTLDEENRIMYYNIIDTLYTMYNNIYFVARSDLDLMPSELTTEKDIAQYILKCSYPNVMFQIRKGKDYSQSIWGIVKKMI